MNKLSFWHSVLENGRVKLFVLPNLLPHEENEVTRVGSIGLYLKSCYDGNFFFTISLFMGFTEMALFIA